MRPARARVLVTVLVSVAVVAGCTVGGGGSGGAGGSGLSYFQFRADNVTVVQHNDSFLYGTRDEPFVYNLWFRVKLGVPNSAQTGLVGDRGVAITDLGDGQSQALSAPQKAAVDFNGLQLLDVNDVIGSVLNQSLPHLELVGTWTWAMEKDDTSDAGVANNLLTILKDALNQFVASGAPLPTDPQQLTAQIVQILLDDIGASLGLVAGALFQSIPGVPDDAIGSRFYVGVGATGTLAQIIDPLLQGVAIPGVQIPIVSVPPDIDGGRLFALGGNKVFTGETFGTTNGVHRYDISVTNTGAPNVPPTASFTSSTTSGAAPLAVSFNAGASADPDGTIVSYNWNFGDFTSGAGQTPSHTFTTAGTFPVTLTVTDNKGASASHTTDISVGGAPASAPTGLTKIGAGCCNTYGDFSWNPIPGATDYEINMDAYFGGGCLVDVDQELAGQRSGGRVQDGLLCLGSHYNTKIRAKANGQWGPWSNTINITL